MDSQTLQSLIGTITRQVLESREQAVMMTLDRAWQLVEAVRNEAARRGVNAVIAVANGAGHPVAVACMDDAYIARYDIALQKAFTVTALKMSTIQLKPMAQPGGALYGIQFTNQGKIVIFGGGEPLMDGGQVMGGLGVSGGTEEQDTALAAFGADYWIRHIVRKA